MAEVAQLCSGGNPKARTQWQEAAKVPISASGKAGGPRLHCKGKDWGFLGASNPCLDPAAPEGQSPKHKLQNLLKC